MILPSFDLLVYDLLDSFHVCSSLKINPSHSLLALQNETGSAIQQTNPKNRGYKHRDVVVFPSHTMAEQQ